MKTVCPKCGGKKARKSKLCMACHKAEPRTQKQKMDSAFTVVYCPREEYPRGAFFNLDDFRKGLKKGWCWPLGMRVEQFGKTHEVVVDPESEAVQDEFGKPWPPQRLRSVT